MDDATSTTVDNVHPFLRRYDQFGIGCIRFFDWTKTLEELRVVHVRTSPFDYVELFVEFSCFVSCLIFLMLCQISAKKKSSTSGEFGIPIVCMTLRLVCAS